MPDAAGGKVLDASALMAWARGSLAMATWSGIAFDLGLTLLVPAHARTEAVLAAPGEADLIGVLLSQPAVVRLGAPSPTALADSAELYDRAGVFDPLAVWVAELCRARGWPALSSDPARLHRVAPSLEITLL